MKVIVGLGNPGPSYQRNRHNVGFEIVDRLASRWLIDVNRNRFHAKFGPGRLGLEQVALVKPQLYMNRSGLIVAEVVSFYKVELENVLIILDDMDLSPGRLRFRSSGSAGGHNGLKDVLEKVGSEAVNRLRIGIGRDRSGEAVGHVLGDFTKEELEEMGPAFEQAERAAECWLLEGVETAMNRFNVVNNE